MSSRAGLIGLLQGRRVEHCLLATPAGGWALVVPGLAARVLAAGLGERNALWVSPSLERCLEGLDWNAGGQRTWLAPELGPRGFFGAGESDWAVPPALDPGAFRLEETRSSSARCRGDCRIASADGAEYRLEITRQVEISDLPSKPPGGAVLLRIRHSLRNTGRTAIAACAGLWSIVQLPCSPEGTLLLPDLPYRSYFGDLPAGWMSRQAGRLELRTAPGRRYEGRPATLRTGSPPGPPAAGGCRGNAGLAALPLFPRRPLPGRTPGRARREARVRRRAAGLQQPPVRQGSLLRAGVPRSGAPPGPGRKRRASGGNPDPLWDVGSAWPWAAAGRAAWPTSGC